MATFWYASDLAAIYFWSVVLASADSFKTFTSNFCLILELLEELEEIVLPMAFLTKKNSKMLIFLFFFHFITKKNYKYFVRMLYIGLDSSTKLFQFTL